MQPTILCAVDDFCIKLQDMVDQAGQDASIVVCPADDDEPSAASARFLLGAYLILNTGAKSQDVIQALRGDKVTTPSACEETTIGSIKIEDGWRALEHAHRLGWLAHPQSDTDAVLDVQELAHYAQRANGSLHMTVPGKVLFFPAPDHLPDGLPWADRLDEAGRPVRRFSARFYATLLADLGVSVVACLSSGSAATARAVEERGMAAVDLGLAGDGSSLLRGLDALLSLARGAPGAVAVHSGEGFVWPGYVGTLVEAFLISRLGFDEGSAGAWLRMVSPWMLP